MALVLAAATPAFAQTSNFTGLSVGIGIDLKSTTLELRSQGTEFSGLGSQNVIGTVSADYGMPLSRDTVILFGGKMDLNKTQIVKVSGNGETVKLEESNHYSLFVAPGLLLNDKTLAFAKLSMESAKYGVNTGNETKQSGHGIGYGAGIRTHISGNWFANVEAGRIVYNSKDFNSANLKTGSTVASIGVTYKF